MLRSPTSSERCYRDGFRDRHFWPEYGHTDMVVVARTRSRPLRCARSGDLAREFAGSYGSSTVAGSLALGPPPRTARTSASDDLSSPSIAPSLNVAYQIRPASSCSELDQ